VKHNQLPEPLRTEYLARYQNDGIVKIPQVAAYRLLDALGDLLDGSLRSEGKPMLKISDARNHSWLAHGLNAAKEEPA
jgi:hypothetical protein